MNYKILILFNGILIPTTLFAAKMRPETRIHVSLLGQPCTLQGNYSEATLRAIHSIGPAQIYPNLSPPDRPGASEDAKKALETIRTIKNLPEDIDQGADLLSTYRKKLIQRIESQVQFIQALPSFKTSRKTASLLEIGKTNFRNLNELKRFESLLKKAENPKTHLVQLSSDQYRELTDNLFDIYNEGIEQDPETKFHQAIKKMNVQYRCSFDEAEESAEE